jgi:riboflavin synthase
VVRTGPVDAEGTAWFTVSLIPETLTRTTLGTKQPGDLVNLEVDVIAKHVEKLVHAYVSTSSTTDTGVTP